MQSRAVSYIITLSSEVNMLPRDKHRARQWQRAIVKRIRAYRHNFPKHGYANMVDHFVGIELEKFRYARFMLKTKYLFINKVG